MKERQQRIYDFIRDYTANNHYPPTIREIAKAVDLKSSSTVHGHLDRMRENGYITFIDTRPRTLQIVK